MTMRTFSRSLGCLACGLAAVGASADVCLGSIPAIAIPSKDVTLSFVRPGRVAKIFVKEGDVVKPGQVLVQLDDAAEQIRLQKLKMLAEDEIAVKAGEAKLAKQKVDLKRLEWAFKEGVATELEVENVKLDVKIAELSLELAKAKKLQYELEHKEAKVYLDRMKITSPTGGVVEKIFLSEGESADALAEVVRVVKIDPLWIDVPVPLDSARELKCGQAANVLFPGETKPRVGKIIHKPAVSDSASNTLTVRVEVANSSDGPAGEHVRVSFPAEEVAARPGGPAGATAATKNEAKTAAKE